MTHFTAKMNDRPTGGQGMAATTRTAHLTPEAGPVYNISGSCLWTFASIVPLGILLLVIAL
ncbi:MAG: hypothetical protein QM728_14480 [Gordonia sp. (in: high G+C Gram-positive bacteria)]|uniref:hypothetical protein n=1 Tax=Gordonia sp. (in: high G+C Gram-positive bacteria) TaxID=84139 RepID=UPI0039E36167